MRLRAALLASLLAPTACAALPPDALVDVRYVAADIRVDLAYHTAKNAFHQRLYRSNVGMLRLPVARRLARVQRRLRSKGLGLKVLDAYRPLSVQRKMWRLRPDGRSRYIANPRNGSKHNRGAAVDLTLVDSRGRELEMPTAFDDFTPRAHRNATRGVTPRARANSRVLETAMRAEGFIPNPYEWWHFTAPGWQRYPVSDKPLPELMGPPYAKE